MVNAVSSKPQSRQGTARANSRLGATGKAALMSSTWIPPSSSSSSSISRPVNSSSSLPLDHLVPDRNVSTAGAELTKTDFPSFNAEQLQLNGAMLAGQLLIKPVTAHIKTKPKPKLRVADDEGMDRTQRLLIVALQLPMVEQLFVNISESRRRKKLSRSWTQWTAVVHELHARAEKLFQRQVQITIHIQRFARGFLARRRVARAKQQLAETRLRRRQLLLQSFQSLVHRLLHVTQSTQLRWFSSQQRFDSAALMIQRCFRGYLGRGFLVLIERQKLLKQLRQWSHGITNNLYHLTDLQEVEALSLIHTAIHFASLPSRPIRGLPSRSLLRQYRAGLYVTFWQVRNRYAQRKLQLKQLLHERHLLTCEDRRAQSWELIHRVHAERRHQLAREEHWQKLREEKEQQRRAAQNAMQLLSDVHDSGQQKIRAEKEVLWRANEQLQRQEAAAEALLEAHRQRECEWMILEDFFANRLRLLEQERNATASAVEQQSRQLLALQTKCFLIDSGRCLVSKQSKALRYSEAQLMLFIQQLDVLACDVWLKILQSLSLHSAFVNQQAHRLKSFAMVARELTAADLLQWTRSKETVEQQRTTTTAPHQRAHLLVNKHKLFSLQQGNQQKKVKGDLTLSRYCDYLHEILMSLLRKCHFNFFAVRKRLAWMHVVLMQLPKAGELPHTDKVWSVDELLRKFRGTHHNTSTQSSASPNDEFAMYDNDMDNGNTHERYQEWNSSSIRSEVLSYLQEHVFGKSGFAMERKNNEVHSGLSSEDKHPWSSLTTANLMQQSQLLSFEMKLAMDHVMAAEESDERNGSLTLGSKKERRNSVAPTSRRTSFSSGSPASRRNSRFGSFGTGDATGNEGEESNNAISISRRLSLTHTQASFQRVQSTFQSFKHSIDHHQQQIQQLHSNSQSPTNPRSGGAAFGGISTSARLSERRGSSRTVTAIADTNFTPSSKRKNSFSTSGTAAAAAQLRRKSMKTKNFLIEKTTQQRLQLNAALACSQSQFIHFALVLQLRALLEQLRCVQQDIIRDMHVFADKHAELHRLRTELHQTKHSLRSERQQAQEVTKKCEESLLELRVQLIEATCFAHDMVFYAVALAIRVLFGKLERERQLIFESQSTSTVSVQQQSKDKEVQKTVAAVVAVTSGKSSTASNPTSKGNSYVSGNNNRDHRQFVMRSHGLVLWSESPIDDESSEFSSVVGTSSFGSATSQLQRGNGNKAVSRVVSSKGAGSSPSRVASLVSMDSNNSFGSHASNSSDKDSVSGVNNSSSVATAGRRNSASSTTGGAVRRKSQQMPPSRTKDSDWHINRNYLPLKDDVSVYWRDLLTSLDSDGAEMDKEAQWFVRLAAKPPPILTIDEDVRENRQEETKRLMQLEAEKQREREKRLFALAATSKKKHARGGTVFDVHGSKSKASSSNRSNKSKDKHESASSHQHHHRRKESILMIARSISMDSLDSDDSSVSSLPTGNTGSAPLSVKTTNKRRGAVFKDMYDVRNRMKARMKEREQAWRRKDQKFAIPGEDAFYCESIVEYDFIRCATSTSQWALESLSIVEKLQELWISKEEQRRQTTQSPSLSSILALDLSRLSYLMKDYELELRENASVVQAVDVAHSSTYRYFPTDDTYDQSTLSVLSGSNRMQLLDVSECVFSNQCFSSTFWALPAIPSLQRVDLDVDDGSYAPTSTSSSSWAGQKAKMRSVDGESAHGVSHKSNQRKRSVSVERDISHEVQNMTAIDMLELLLMRSDVAVELQSLIESEREKAKRKKAQQRELKANESAKGPLPLGKMMKMSSMASPLAARSLSSDLLATAQAFPSITSIDSITELASQRMLIISGFDLEESIGRQPLSLLLRRQMIAKLIDDDRALCTADLLTLSSFAQQSTRVISSRTLNSMSWRSVLQSCFQSLHRPASAHFPDRFPHFENELVTSWAHGMQKEHGELRDTLHVLKKSHWLKLRRETISTVAATPAGGNALPFGSLKTMSLDHGWDHNSHLNTGSKKVTKLESRVEISLQYDRPKGSQVALSTVCAQDSSSMLSVMPLFIYPIFQVGEMARKESFAVRCARRDERQRVDKKKAEVERLKRQHRLKHLQAPLKTDFSTSSLELDDEGDEDSLGFLSSDDHNGDDIDDDDNNEHSDSDDGCVSKSALELQREHEEDAMIMQIQLIDERIDQAARLLRCALRRRLIIRKELTTAIVPFLQEQETRYWQQRELENEESREFERDLARIASSSLKRKGNASHRRHRSRLKDTRSSRSMNILTDQQVSPTDQSFLLRLFSCFTSKYAAIHTTPESGSAALTRHPSSRGGKAAPSSSSLLRAISSRLGLSFVDDLPPIAAGNSNDNSGLSEEDSSMSTGFDLQREKDRLVFEIRQLVRSYENERVMWRRSDADSLSLQHWAQQFTRSDHLMIFIRQYLIRLQDNDHHRRQVQGIEDDFSLDHSEELSTMREISRQFDMSLDSASRKPSRASSLRQSFRKSFSFLALTGSSDRESNKLNVIEAEVEKDKFATFFAQRLRDLLWRDEARCLDYLQLHHRRSWITDEIVHRDAHVTLPHGHDDNLEIVAKQAKRDQAFRSSSIYKRQTNEDQQRWLFTPPPSKVTRSSDNSMGSLNSSKKTNHVKEMIVGGSSRRAIVVMRVVEDDSIDNPLSRGRFLVETVDSKSLAKANGWCSSLGISNCRNESLDDRNAVVALRMGFQTHKLCAVQRDSLAQYSLPVSRTDYPIHRRIPSLKGTLNDPSIAFLSQQAADLLLLDSSADLALLQPLPSIREQWLCVPLLIMHHRYDSFLNKSSLESHALKALIKWQAVVRGVLSRSSVDHHTLRRGAGGRQSNSNVEKSSY